MALTEQQVKERVNYIGASDAPAALGLSRWKTVIGLWAEKVKLIEPEDISNKLPVKLGNRMEPIVVELFEEETGKTARRVNETQYHPKFPFLAANIDRRVVGENAIVEVKTASAWKAKEWEGEEIPHEYIIQVQQTLAVTGAAYAYLAVLIGNQSFIWKKVERDQEMIQMIEKRLVDFWQNYVIPKVMPQEVKAADSETLYKLFPFNTPGSEIILGDDAVRLIESRQSLLADKSSISKQIDQMDAEIKALLGENEAGIAGQYRVTWKSFERAEYVVKASKGRTLRITEAKQNGNE